MIRVDYLFTCLKKTNMEIIEMVNGSKVFGNVIVGNQLANQNKTETIHLEKCTLTILHQTSSGVSRNRNVLIDYSKADYVAFLDDDGEFIDNGQEFIENYLQENDFDVVRFNTVFNSSTRSYPIFKNKKELKYKDIKNLGPIGFFFKTSSLKTNNIKFNESIGPGTNINHGEDTIFLRDIANTLTINNCERTCIAINEKVSTWHDETTRNLEQELFSHGFLYKILFGRKAKFYAWAFLLTHMYCYPKGTKRRELFKYMKKGIKYAGEL